MKIILIEPCSKTTRSLSGFRKSMFLFPPIGIAYIASVLERNGIEVEVIDQLAEDIENQGVLEIIKRKSPEIVGFSCLTPNMGAVKEITALIRGLNKGTKIVLGNVHASIFARELLEQNWADFIIHGEAEYTMLELALAIEGNCDFGNIPGLSYKENDKVYNNKPREQANDLDSLPYPAWHLFDLRRYKTYTALFPSGPALPISGQRGCSYRCIYCAQDVIFKCVKQRSPLKLADEINFFYERFKVKTFVFVNSSFPISKESGLMFSDELIRRGLNKKIIWFTETRVDMVDLELLKKMRLAGLRWIQYGIEVGNSKTLDSIEKKATLKDAARAVYYAKKAGITCMGLFMLGLPGESKETCMETINFAKKLDSDFAVFTRAIPFPGSRFFEIYKTKLNFNVDNYDKFNWWRDPERDEELVYTPEGMCSRDLIDLQNKAWFKFYVRPGLIIRYLIRGKVPPGILYHAAYRMIKNYFLTLMG